MQADASDDAPDLLSAVKEILTTVRAMAADWEKFRVLLPEPTSMRGRAMARRLRAKEESDGPQGFPRG